MNPLTCTPTCTLVRRRVLRETNKPLTYTAEVPLRGVAQLGSAPALGANFWRRWASASVGNAGFLSQLRRPASVGVGAVFGTVWDAVGDPPREGANGERARPVHAGICRAAGSRNQLAFW